MKNTIIFPVCILMFLGINVFASNDHNDDPPFTRSAHFKGGESALSTYIATHLVYPECAKDNGREGEVLVSFFVLPDGTIHNPKIVEGLTERCDRIALETVANMPNWVPARKEGRVIGSKQYIKLEFSLEGF